MLTLWIGSRGFGGFGDLCLGLGFYKQKTSRFSPFPSMIMMLSSQILKENRVKMVSITIW